MNALACLSPTAAPASTGTKPPSRDDDAEAGGFADCMAQACRSQPPTQEEAAERGATASVEEGPNDAPTATEPVAPQPDLAALLPGWSAAAPTAPIAPTASAQPGGDSTALPAAAVPRGAVAAELHTEVAGAGVAPASTPTRVETGAEADAVPEAARDAARSAAPQPRTTSAEPSGPATPTPTLSPPTAPTLRAPEFSAPPSAPLAPRLDTPAFAPALATQVRWWAQEGVQHAQLTLNPPEMGPVAVKIVVLDQREARIDFVADVAATRSAIEAALPVLAAALDESGLKLSGGGVHDGTAQRQASWQQAQQQAQQAASQRAGVTQRTTGDAGLTPGAQAPARTTAARGLVDLLA